MRRLSLWNNWDPSRYGLIDLLNKELEPMHTETQRAKSFVPALEVNESEERYVVMTELPGVGQKDISLEVKEGQLVLKGEKKSQSEGKNYSERSFGEFERVISLPETVDEGAIEAQFENGVLSIRLPKKPKKESKTILIQSA